MNTPPKKFIPAVTGLEILAALRGQNQPNRFWHQMDSMGGKYADVFRAYKTNVMPAVELPAPILDQLRSFGFTITDTMHVALVSLLGGIYGNHFLVYEEGTDHVFMKRAVSSNFHPVYAAWKDTYFKA